MRLTVRDRCVGQAIGINAREEVVRASAIRLRRGEQGELIRQMLSCDEDRLFDYNTGLRLASEEVIFGPPIWNATRVRDEESWRVEFLSEEWRLAGPISVRETLIVNNGQVVVRAVCDFGATSGNILTLRVAMNAGVKRNASLSE